MAKSKVQIQRKDLPAFSIPLKDDELRDLGRLTVAWGQIDTMMLNTMQFLAKTDGLAINVFLETTTTGVRLGMFKKLIDRIHYAAIRELAGDFCERMGALIEKRNHILHGLWGWHVDWKAAVGTPACYFSKVAPRYIYASDLADLVKRVNGETIVLHRVMSSMMGTESFDPEHDTGVRPAYMFSEGAPQQGVFPKLL